MFAKPGSRWRSVTCTTEVVVVKAVAGEVDLQCGGQPMVAHDAMSDVVGRPAAGAESGTLMGKRYVNADETIELLCTKPGDGALSIGGALLVPKGAKPLPSSD